MEIKATPSNLTSLISTLLIRLRNENIERDTEILNDLKSLVNYLDKISNKSLNQEALFDKSFITSNDDLNDLHDSLSEYSYERISAFKESLPDSLTAINKEKIEEIKEQLRRVAGAIISFNSNKIYG